MLGRRQIREKIIQTLYAYQQNPINQGVLERNMIANLEKIQNLYVYQLNFLVSLKHLAENQIEIGKTKFIKTEADLNPNQKFGQMSLPISIPDHIIVFFCIKK